MWDGLGILPRIHRERTYFSSTARRRQSRHLRDPIEKQKRRHLRSTFHRAITGGVHEYAPHRNEGGGVRELMGNRSAASCVFIPTIVGAIDRDHKTYISRYVSNASFAAISSLRSFGGGTGPSSDGGSYSFDQGDLHERAWDAGENPPPKRRFVLLP